jgi:hypothetical protein
MRATEPPPFFSAIPRQLSLTPFHLADAEAVWYQSRTARKVPMI